jgi:glycosyltransferase involved in cell wall biosynthesis
VGKSDVRILMLTSYLPYPPNSGGNIRMLELLRFLRPRHEVTLVSFIFSEQQAAAVAALSRYCKRVIPVLHTRQIVAQDDERPRCVAALWTREMRACLAAINAEARFDLMQIEHIFMAQYAPLIDAPVILHEHNIESLVLKREADLLAKEEDLQSPTNDPRATRNAESEWKKMSRYESSIWPQFSFRIVVSELDRLEMTTRCPSGKVVLVPNGVRTDELQPVAPNGSSGVIFMGAMDYAPNRDAAAWLCDSIWPHVLREAPKACLYIVGRNPPPWLLERNQRGAIEIAANVPSVVPYAKKCSVSVVPIRVGGGTRLKILISMALGLAVISTSIGCEGLDLEAPSELLRVDDPIGFARRTSELLRDQERQRSLAQAGRLAVEQRYDWQRIFPVLEKQYLEIVRG